MRRIRPRGRLFATLIATTLIAVVPALGAPSAGAVIATPTTGTLTVHATDEVNAPAVCINNWIAADAGRAAACLEVSNAYGASTTFRFGTYYLDDLSFVPSTGWLSDSIDASDATVKSLTCSGGDQFLGLGPVTVGGVTSYYGEDVHTSTTAGWTKYTGGTCTALSGVHTLTKTEWLTPTYLCPGGITPVSTATALRSAINGGAATVCIAKNATIDLNDTNDAIKLISTANFQLIGDPLQRPIIDATHVTSTPTAGIYANSSTGATLANFIVENAPRGTACSGCGAGIYAGPDFEIYNVLAYNNAVNGVNAHEFTLEDSAVVGNGNLTDVGNTSGGVKSSKAYTAIWDYVDDNLGVGLWCDSGCAVISPFTGWLVHRNYVADNSRGGIRQEISSTSSDIAYNFVAGNVTDSSLTITQQKHHAGIESVDSQNMLIQYNTFESTAAQSNIWWDFVVAGDDGRTPRPANITFKNNTLDPDGNGIDCTHYLGSGTSNIVCTPNS